MTPESTDSRRNVLKVIGASGAAGLTGLAGCVGGDGDGDGGGDGGNGGTTTTDTSFSGEVKLGLLSPESGAYSYLGEAERQGAMLALQEAEEEFGITVELSQEDTEFNPQTAVQKLERLITREGVEAVVAHSSAGIQLGNRATENGVPIMVSSTAADAASGSECAEYAFNLSPSISMMANSGASMLADYADKWFMIVPDYAAGRNIRDVLTPKLEERGAEVVGTSVEPLGANDYTSALNQVEDSDAEGILPLLTGTDLRTAVNQIVDRGMDDYAIGGSLIEDNVVWEMSKEIAAVLDRFTTWWTPAIETDKTRDFLERVHEEYDTTAYGRHWMGYTAMDQMLRAIVRAEGTDPDEIRGTLEGHDFSDVGLKEGKQYFRECDHRAVTSTYGVTPRSVDEMEDDPYRIWFDVTERIPGEDIIRPCEETGCTF